MKRIAIIGGGLAGCAAAYVLKRAGLEPVIYEASGALASGASGNAVGLYNPRFGAEFSAQSRYFSGAFDLAGQVFSELEGIDYDPSGCLHLITDEKKQIRFAKMIENWGWAEEDMRLLLREDASEIAGIELAHEALYLPRSGTVSPPKLCAAYADGVEVHLNARVESLDDVEADAVILAAGPALRGFEGAKGLDLRAVRGQVTMIKEALPIKTNICYSGYVTKARGGMHMVGSTFQRWLDHSEVMDADDAENLERMGSAIPAAAGGFDVADSRASVRVTSRDHFPIVGQLSERVYISSAHGSHGILSSLMGAQILRDMILGKEPCVDQQVLDALSPRRYDAP